MTNRRKVWFITRPERDPKFHTDALEALKIATNNFEDKWTRNRDAHKNYERVLAQQELKRNNISEDGSGGRTWAAMLRTFSYVYTDEEGKQRITKVGQALLDNDNRRENISKQILTLQIPNAYFLESGFRPKFEETFQIRPARFLIRLVNQKELDYYLTKEEITFFALTTQYDNQLYNVTRQIIAFRKATTDEKEAMRIDIASEYDHRERSDKGARDFATAHGDVAHTFMMLCEYTELVNYIRGDALRVESEKSVEVTKYLNEYDARYPFSKRFLISSVRFAEHAGLDIKSYKSSPFGTIAPASNNAKNLRKVHELLADYPLIQTMPESEIVDILRTEFTKAEATKYASQLLDFKYTSLNEDFVESYLNEESDLAFEEKTMAVLKAIGFEAEFRPKPVNQDVRTEIEILIHVDDENICIIDAKNYREKFPLTASFASHMGSEYIPNYQGYKGKKVSHFGYITASDWGGVHNLKKITEKAKVAFPEETIQGSLITARALLGFLDHCLENDIGPAERKALFISCFTNKGYNTVSEMIK